ncbi:sulfur carrier protein ThiS [Glaciecola sp. 2405UD65-10]|uniref:sulfur carrier protein ThiS n=1 Tax=Glaciecola sp. 2405UD65-10 TaxID=3397244 RepID=UPI003B59D4F5
MQTRAKHMKKIQVNSESVTCHSDSLADLLEEKGYSNATVATAVNGCFVAQQNRYNKLIEEGDRIEILAPMQGG